MPTVSNPGALLALAADEHSPWNWPVWQKRTNLNGAPYAVESGAPIYTKWTATTAEAVSAFAKKFWSLNEADQLAFIKPKDDQDAIGRKAWASFVSSKWASWKISETISQTLVEHRVHPYMVMQRMKQSTVNFLCQFDPSINLKLYLHASYPAWYKHKRIAHTRP
jgi:hypothetical protein